MNPRLTLALLACTGLLLACPSPTVPDIDECLTDNGGCATTATCTNTPGSFQCACNPGYMGDGKTCADVDECLTNNGACSPNAACTNTPGSRSCACVAGYVGDGVTCRRYIANGDFTEDFSGWVTEGSCLGETQIVQDDAVHGKALALGLGGAFGCDTTKLWQVAALDISGRSSVRIRADVKMMQSYVYTGAINLRVYTGSAPSYNQQLIGNHVFQVGALSETSALDGTTSLPLGTWYAWTSENLKPLLPAGAQYLRVELWIQGNGTYGWSRVDNVILVVDDTAIPTVDMSADVTSGHPPLAVRFTSTCSDTGGRCASHSWDFGDGPIEHGRPGGGTSATVANPTHTFTQPGTFQVSYTVEDDQGAASTVFRTLTATNEPPTVSIDASSSGGTGALNVQFTSTTTDDHQLASYAWDFGDGTSATVPNPAHTYATPGTYKATLTVTDDHGLAATASYTVVVRGTTPLGNGDFSSELKGWVAEGNCLGETQVRSDDDVHGRVLGFGQGGAFDCNAVKVWQVAAVDVAAASSVRIRADVKMMQSNVYTGPIHLRVYAGTAPSYDQQLLGTHVFQAGELSESSALEGTSVLPLGSWYAWTSDDLESLLPSGTQYLRVELWIQGRGYYGWARVDNVKVVLDDPALPTASTSADVTTGHPPLTVKFTGTCTDSDGTCASHAWDFGDAPVQTTSPGGGGASSSPSPTYTFQNAGTFQVGYTVEDNRGAARTVFRTITTVNQPPAPAISATPANGPAPLAIQFTGSAVDDHQVASYAWDFGDGATSTVQNPSHTYANPGTYLVKLTATDDHGATGSTTYTVVVTGGAPLANSNFSNELKGWVAEGNCLGETQVRGDDNVHGRVLGFGQGGAFDCNAVKVWQVAAVDVAAASSVRIRADVKMMQSYVYTGPIHLRVYAGTAPSYDQQLLGTHVFEVSPLEESSALTGTTRLPLGTWYAWTSNDIKPLLPAGTTFLRVELWIQGRGNYGWARVDNVKVVLNDSALPSIAFTRNPASGSAPLAVQFTGTCSDLGSPCASFAWDFGDGAVDAFTSSGGGSATSASPSYTFTGSSTYTVSFTAEDAHGGARSVLSSVSTVNAPPTASIQTSASVGPAPLTVQFTGAASDTDGTVVSYAWNFGDGSSTTVQNPSHTFTKQGTYNVSFTVTDDRGAFTTATTTIIVQ